MQLVLLVMLLDPLVAAFEHVILISDEDVYSKYFWYNIKR